MVHTRSFIIYKLEPSLLCGNLQPCRLPACVSFPSILIPYGLLLAQQEKGPAVLSGL